MTWKALWWGERSQAWEGLEEGLADGIAAYASCQASIQRALSNSFTLIWDTPLLADVEAARGVNASLDDEDIAFATGTDMTGSEGLAHNEGDDGLNEGDVPELDALGEAIDDL